jgi:hypothetical protein
LNGGSWKDRFLTANEITALTLNVGGFGNPSIPQIINLALADVHQGNNTLEFRTINASNYPVVIGNIELNVRTSGTTALIRGTPAYQQTSDVVCSSRPLGSAVMLRIQVPAAQQIRLDICTISGQIVRHLADGMTFGAGIAKVVWNGNDAAGHAQMPGVYLLRGRVGDRRFESKVFKLR